MRFGHTSLEFAGVANQIISGGVADFFKFNIVDHVRASLEIEHISVAEISADIQHIIPNALSEQAINGLIDLKDELGHAYTAHLPLWSLELATFNEPIRRGGVKSVVDAINHLEPIDPEVYVLHSTGALATEFSRENFPKPSGDMISMLMAGFSATSIEEILSQTEINPAKIAVENIEFPFDITRDVIDEYGLSICFDTGHLLSKQSGNESMLEFWSKHRDKIIELHLHDGRPSKPDERGYIDHNILGTGDMPVREFLMELLKDGFDGPIIFELSAGEIVESLKHIKEVIPEALE
ncbi:MAG: cobamide remodeling phosphodiesterase CbiR [Candidatus Thorarchaeota archaeon]|jgi:sugar phosphate isomerase/epimerase